MDDDFKNSLCDSESVCGSESEASWDSEAGVRETGFGLESECLRSEPITSGSQSITADESTTCNKSRSQPDKPIGNVITHAHSVPTGPSRSSDDAPHSVATDHSRISGDAPVEFVDGGRCQCVDAQSVGVGASDGGRCQLVDAQSVGAALLTVGGVMLLTPSHVRLHHPLMNSPWS